MKLPAIKIVFLLISISTLSSCFHDDDDIPVGMVGKESDRIAGLGIEHVIHISVDGLHPSAITRLGKDKLPGFYRMREGGSYTDNARTDGDFAYTLPNHSSQLTGRPVDGAKGHNWIFPEDIDKFGINLHEIKGSYVTGIFDIVHDFGLSTALYTGKSKFLLFDDSWDGNSAAIDAVEPDSGRDKIDKYVLDLNTATLVDRFIADLTANKYNYAFLHLKDPDTAGHEFKWSLKPDSEYLKAVKRVDVLLVKILDFIDQNADFKGATVLVLTADHGGIFGTNIHLLSRSKGLLDSGVVPFYIYGKLIPAAKDLYTWNPKTTIDPGKTHPYNNDESQPIRNGDAANLILELLGLPNVPGSSINNLNFPYFQENKMAR